MCTLDNRIAAFVSSTLGIAESRVSSESLLRSDLGLDGDDAEEFFEKFASEFQVDLSDLDLEVYFFGEAWFETPNFIKRLVGIPVTEKSREREDISIGDMQKFARNGRWHLPSQ